MSLYLIWFVLLGVLLAGYSVLDGFDLGVGILHPLAKTDEERRIFLNSIGPIWDGNEVWLVTFGGALFAAFPEAYATIFSGFYTAFMLLLFALIFRAVSIEFRSKVGSVLWRAAWDAGFFLSSLTASILFGIAIGNVLVGISLNERGVFTGTFMDLLRPFPLLVGVLTVSMFAMHGALYLHLRIPLGPLHTRMKEWIWHTWGTFLVLYLLTTIYALMVLPQAVPHGERAVWAAPVIVLNVLALANIPRATYRNRPGHAFVSSGVSILCLVTLFGLSLWPNLVVASRHPEWSLTVYRAASSVQTLKIMLIIACIGIPLVLAYTTIIYWTFRRRVQVEKTSY